MPLSHGTLESAFMSKWVKDKFFLYKNKKRIKN